MENKSIGSYNSLKLDYYHPDDKYHFMFTQIPDFLFEDPVCQKLSNTAKLLFGKMLRETRLAAKKGNIDTDEIIAWSKDKYNLLINDSKKSYVSNCAKAIIDAISIATDKEDFITLMNKAGWSVQWENSRKHIVFQNESGQKVRDSNIEKTFPGLKISKESLSEEFSKHIVSVQEPPVINHAPDSGPIATDNKPEIPSKLNPKRVSFKEKLAQKKKEADLFNREHTTRVQKNREHISR